MRGTPERRTDEPGRLAYTVRRIRRHARWARTEGISRLIEEDQLDPRKRIATAIAKARWRRHHRIPTGSAMPVYIVGLQRSGTNMLLRGLDADAAIEVRGENDSRLFRRFRLRSHDQVRTVVARSRHQIVLIKPLCDSQWVDELLALSGGRPGRAVWVYRNVDDRARSEIAKFGGTSLEALRAVAAGTDAGMWQSERLGTEARRLIGSFDYTQMSADSGAALFWYVRNGLYFDLGLDGRDDVLLCSYDALVAEPEQSMRALCDFIDFPCPPSLWAHVERRSTHATRSLQVDPRIRELCDDLAERLDAARVRQAERHIACEDR